MNTIIYCGLSCTTTAATVILGIRCLNNIQCYAQKKITKISDINSKNDAVSFLRAMCSNKTSSDELNDALLINIHKYGYTQQDKEKIFSFMHDTSVKPTEDFALTVIWAMIICYEELSSSTATDTTTSVLHLAEQNLVSF